VAHGHDVSFSGWLATADSLLSASSLRRSDSPCSLKSAKSGTSKISLSSLALEFILRNVRSALLPFEADPGNSSFSTSSLVIWSMRIAAIFVCSNSRQPFL
jgi:hypothetical protein